MDSLSLWWWSGILTLGMDLWTCSLVVAAVAKSRDNVAAKILELLLLSLPLLLVGS